MTKPVFTTNWASSRDYWADMFAELGLLGQPDLHFLEVGCFEGQATLWLMENVLTHVTSDIVVIDTFGGNPEFAGLGVEGNSYDRFVNNLEPWIDDGRVAVIHGPSQLRLRYHVQQFDFIYIDGSHAARDVLADAVLAWPLLRSGCVMCFDDYVGLKGEEWEIPQIAVDAFVSCYYPEIAHAERRGMDQYTVRKV